MSQIAGKKFILGKDGGIRAELCEYGARLMSFYVPDKNGDLKSVVLGFSNPSDYLKDTCYLGCIAGRFANRIRGGKFLLDGKTYNLPQNDGKNTLHGGSNGFDKVLWSGEQDAGGVTFSYLSQDGGQGFPGNLHCQVIYSLEEQGESTVLTLDFLAECDKTTPVSVTNHAYFNLNGAGSGSINDHDIRIRADFYTPVDSELLPTGEISAVNETPYDLREVGKLSKVIKETGGLDNNFVVDGRGMRTAAILSSEASGISLIVKSDLPGLQVYTGNFLDGSMTGIGGTYNKHGGVCLETQHFPDSVNIGHFPSPFVKAGEIYRTTTQFVFQRRG